MLKDEIERAKRSVSTDTVQITIGEVSNMYSSKELNINPEFQRLFRWSSQKKSNFIESILIGIPIPPAFAYENSDGTWELIDGLQRISTVLEFMGLLRDPETKKLRRSELNSTKYLPSLEGAVWEKKNDSEKELEKSLQLFFRRHRIDFQILKHPSDPKTKFDLFQRLNRGGAYANEQEVRTCSMVLSNPKFTNALREVSIQSDFKEIYQIGRDQVKVQKDLEYAVRMLVLTYRYFPVKKDVQEFLDKAILEIMDEHEIEKALEPIKWSVSTLYRLFGAEALVPPETATATNLSKRFSLRALEGIAVGIARNADAIKLENNPDDFIKEKMSRFWDQDEVSEMSSSGLRGTVRLQRSVPFGAKWFNPNDDS